MEDWIVRDTAAVLVELETYRSKQKQIRNSLNTGNTKALSGWCIGYAQFSILGHCPLDRGVVVSST
jgi:hypothetical protein